MLSTKLKERAELERARLASGEKPEPKLRSPIQRVAVRALAVFFAVMLGLTLLSRAADGITVPRVQTEGSQSGVLTQRVNARGTINPQEDLTVTLPGGILVSNVVAKEGQRVAAGDVLLELDTDDLRRQMTALEEKLRILNLRLAAAAAGATSADTDAVLEAQRVLAEKQTDFEALKEKLARAGQRADEDLTAAQQEHAQAILDYDKAVEKAKKNIIKAADEAVKAAQDALDETKASSLEAIDAAKQTLESAQDAEGESESRSAAAYIALGRAKDRLTEAKEKLNELQMAETPDPEAIAAAQAAVESAQANVDSCQATADGYSSSNAYSNVKRAKENLKRTQDKWDQKVKDAQAKLDEVKQEQEDKKKNTDATEEAAVQSAQAAIDAAERAVKSGQRSAEDSGFTAQEQLDQAQRDIESAQRGVESAQKKVDDAGLSDEKSRQQAEIERLGYLSEQRVLQQDLRALRDVAAKNGQLTAPIPGLVKSILAEPGVTQQGGRLAVLSRADQGFAFTCKVDQEQAAKLAVGDKGRLTWTQDGKSLGLDVTVGALGAVDDKDMVELTVDLPQASYPSGGSAELELSKRSEQYDLTLPIGALRADGQDQFVLVLRERQTVMGVEQTVEAVPIEVKEKDSERMAFTSSALGWDDQVIVSASKPLDKGDRVRLEATP